MILIRTFMDYCLNIFSALTQTINKSHKNFHNGNCNFTFKETPQPTSITEMNSQEM